MGLFKNTIMRFSEFEFLEKAKPISCPKRYASTRNYFLLGQILVIEGLYVKKKDITTCSAFSLFSSVGLSE